MAHKKKSLTGSTDTELASLMEAAAKSMDAKSRYKDLRKTVYYFLERPETKIAVCYHLLNLLLIVGSIITSILSTIQSYEDSGTLRDLIFYYEISLLSWFIVEYGARLWSCSFLGKYKGYRGKFRFMRTLYMMIDLFVIVSTLTTAILSIKTAYFTILRITRFLQIFRILRLDRQRGDLRTMGRVVYKHRKELVTCYFVGFIILFGGTYLIYIIEKSSAENSTIDNMANGLYWAMITVTSVGYGDISPETWAGKLLTGVFALVGCAFFALPAGILGSGFALQVAKQKKQRRFIKVRNPAAVVLQTFWRNYAVRPRNYQLQGTWFFFFPQILGKNNTPDYYKILPGVQEIMKSSVYPNKMVMESEEERTKKGFSLKRVKRSMTKQFSNGTTSQEDREEDRRLHRLKLRTSGKADRRKKSSNVMPLSSLLNKQYKEAIRFVVKVKLFQSIKIFKNVRYPFVNVQDIMEKNALCHTETLSYLKHIQESLHEFRQEIQEIRLLIDNVPPELGNPSRKTSSSSKSGLKSKDVFHIQAQFVTFSDTTTTKVADYEEPQYPTLEDANEIDEDGGDIIESEPNGEIENAMEEVDHDSSPGIDNKANYFDSDIL